MTVSRRRRERALACLVSLALVSGCVTANPIPGQVPNAASAAVVSPASIRARMEMLASDALQGRASGSRDSWVAATYIAAELRRIGLDPAGDGGGYLQSVSQPIRGADPAGDPSASTRRSWNVIGRLPGADPAGREKAILLSAHLDHIGVSGAGPDRIHNGADDNASGVTAVLELAEALARGRRPRRTIVVALLDAEESGGLGADEFLARPPVPLPSFVVNLNFEMVGRPDPAVPRGTVWLTGYERSTLGPELARRGARLVADPHPASRFFERSDNITFAYSGMVAQTISSYGLHRDYHTAADEISRIDFDHMGTVIGMLVAPIRSLADSDFEPEWLPGLRPVRPAARTR